MKRENSERWSLLAGTCASTKSRTVRPKRSRRVSIVGGVAESTVRSSKETETTTTTGPSSTMARAAFVSSTLPFVLTLAVLSCSVEKLPVPTTAFHSNIHINNNNNNNNINIPNHRFRSSNNRIHVPTIRTTTATANNGRFCSENRNPIDSSLAFARNTRIASSAPRTLGSGNHRHRHHHHLVVAAATGRVGGGENDNNNDGEGDDEYVEELYEKFDDQKLFPFEFDVDVGVDDEDSDFDYDEDEDDKEYLKRGLARLESMERMLQDIEEYCSIEGLCEDEDYDDEEEDVAIGGDDDDNDDDKRIYKGDADDVDDMEALFDFLEDTMGDDVGGDDDDEDGGGDDDDDDTDEEIFLNKTEDPKDEEKEQSKEPATTVMAKAQNNFFSPIGLEEALLQGVVPVEAGVGSGALPGDFGFDPCHFSDKDYVKEFQYRFLNWLPGGNPNNDPLPDPRPTALVLRDYREAEIRHGRLAMLAVIIWPIQEKLDNFFLGSDTAGPLLYGPVTLPYLPLFMTLVMMLLGYLDIYTKDIQEEEGVGDAFLPGDCFWDPLRILEGAPPTMKRNMQERELFNGRVAMLAFAAFFFEELTSHQAIVDIPGNEVLFLPAYQIPSVQEWLDSQFLETYSGR